VWAKAVEIGVPLACHSVGMGFTERNSPSNFVYNHCGHFAAAGEAVAKSLVLGGVFHRFPQLRVALLEGGAVNGVRLLSDLVSRWDKRGREGLERLDPANIDLAALADLLARYDSPSAAFSPEHVLESTDWSPAERDDFAESGIERVEDLCARFATNLYWGCEADDPLVGLAFDRRVNPRGLRVPAVMGSDIGHWDVPHFEAPLADAWELVEQGILDTDQFRDFVFTNAVRLYGGSSPGFFTGTAVEQAAASVTSPDDTQSGAAASHGTRA
jgi:hypothetical protein